MIKDEIRGEMRRKRREMTADTVDAFSEAIKEGLFSLQCMKKAGTVCTFLSAFKEPDTIRIVTALRKNGCRIIVPISHTDTNTLSLSYIDGIEDLHKGAYGILEPNVVGEADSDEIDVILVPGLAFDREGGRMGFGKGYYDRLLEKSTAVKIGLCYDFQLFDKIPKEKHDVPMDYIITEKEICERSLD